MRLLQFTAVLLFLILPVATACAQDAPSLNETIHYLIDKITNGAGGTSSEGVGFSYRVTQFSEATLTIVMTVSKDVTQVYTINLPLSKLSPDINVGESDLGGGYCKLTISTSDGSAAIISKAYTNSSALSCFQILFKDKTQARSVANAFKHAIELSGGKADPFAPTAPSQ